MQDVWKKVLNELDKDLFSNLDNSLIRSLVPDKEDRTNTLVFRIEDKNKLSYIKNRIQTPLQTRLKSLMGRDIVVRFELSENHSEFEPKNEISTNELTDYHANLLNRYITGPSNELAHLAAHEAVNHPGKNNPLFIHADPGCGKSHLARAISNEFVKQNARVLYITAELLKEQYTHFSQLNNFDEFRNELKSYTCFIIEDVQNLQYYSDALLDEFFLVFNHHYTKGHQIVLTADRPVVELNLSDRLLSRFLSGLHVRILPPDNTLIARIIDEKLEILHLDLNQDVIRFLKTFNYTTIREIESVLNTLYFFKQQNKDINQVHLVKQYIDDFNSHEGDDLLLPDQILATVCEYYSIRREDVLSSSRKAEFALPRHVIMYLCVQHTRLNKSAIARFLHRSDHTTVINAEKKIERLLKDDPKFHSVIQHLIEKSKKNRG